MVAATDLKLALASKEAWVITTCLKRDLKLSKLRVVDSVEEARSTCVEVGNGCSVGT